MHNPGAPPCLQAFNGVISRMVTAVLWTSPLGVASLIAAALCRSCRLGATAAALGLWVLVVGPPPPACECVYVWGGGPA